MPCDSGGFEENEARRLREELDRVTAMFCEVMRGLETKTKVMGSISPEIRRWWAEHKVYDAKRKTQELRDLDQQIREAEQELEEMRQNRDRMISRDPPNRKIRKTPKILDIGSRRVHTGLRINDLL